MQAEGDVFTLSSPWISNPETSDPVTSIFNVLWMP
jgi:hypothetical protein